MGLQCVCGRLQSLDNAHCPTLHSIHEQTFRNSYTPVTNIRPLFPAYTTLSSRFFHIFSSSSNFHSQSFLRLFSNIVDEDELHPSASQIYILALRHRHIRPNPLPRPYPIYFSINIGQLPPLAGREVVRHTHLLRREFLGDSKEYHPCPEGSSRKLYWFISTKNRPVPLRVSDT